MKRIVVVSILVFSMSSCLTLGENDFEFMKETSMKDTGCMENEIKILKIYDNSGKEIKLGMYKGGLAPGSWIAQCRKKTFGCKSYNRSKDGVTDIGADCTER
ncbi:MAG: hypothetical protein HRU19_30805 [Pseudobacteriovorax sp.]|nr:hypothetical protein [Pseudobacteriovorax sp.]